MKSTQIFNTQALPISSSFVHPVLTVKHPAIISSPSALFISITHHFKNPKALLNRARLIGGSFQDANLSYADLSLAVVDETMIIENNIDVTLPAYGTNPIDI